MVKPHELLVSLDSMCYHTYICDLSTGSSSRALQGVTPREILSSEGFPTYMLSAVIPAEHSYSALLLAKQLIH